MSANGKIQTKNVFVKTVNVRNFSVLMENLALSAGEGRMGLVYGQSGRGKTRTAIEWHANNRDSHYLYILKIWKTSIIHFLRALAVEVGVKNPPINKNVVFSELVNVLVHNPVPVFLDEMEKLTQEHLEVVRGFERDHRGPRLSSSGRTSCPRSLPNPGGPGPGLLSTTSFAPSTRRISLHTWPPGRTIPCG